MREAVAVDQVSKTYQLGSIGGATLKEDVERWWARLRGRPDPLLKVDEEHQQRRIGERLLALDRVSFTVAEGEVLGLVGPNGAGKSTLLKILSQVTAPTSGEIRVHGRVASLLEVGTGFHHDLTGRENIYLNGAILGMTKAEIRRKFDEIVAFSECEAFIDTPVKRYSSGMYVRLAFAVAAHLEPEILVIDEVLAVGDAQFQRKCLGKMGDVSRSGRTIIFVSHNMVAVQSLCQHAVLLSGGRVAARGPASAVISQYLKTTFVDETTKRWSTAGDAPGNDVLRVRQIHVRAVDDRSDGLITMESPIEIDTEFWIQKAGVELHITYHLVNEQGIVVLTTPSAARRREAGLYRAAFTIPGGLLNSGGYSLRLYVVEDGNRVTYEQGDLIAFTVADVTPRLHAYVGREPGVVQPHLRWAERPMPEIENAWS